MLSKSEKKLNTETLTFSNKNSLEWHVKRNVKKCLLFNLPGLLLLFFIFLFFMLRKEKEKGKSVEIKR